MNARLEGVRTENNKIYTWYLVFTEAIKPGNFGQSNRWIVSVDQITREIVFKGNGLFLNINLDTLTNDVLSAGKGEKMVIGAFHELLKRYPKNIYTSVTLQLEVKDEEIRQYLLDPFPTIKIKPLRALNA